MGAVISSPRDKIAYYQDQAGKLRRQAQQTRIQTDDIVQVKRLEDLAVKADEEAASLNIQLNEMVKD